MLEAFAEMPEYHLTVCGPMNEDVEKDFKKAFIKSFIKLRTFALWDGLTLLALSLCRLLICAALIYPSCSEGGGEALSPACMPGLFPF